MTKNTDSERIAYPALHDPPHSSDLLRLFTPTSVEVDWACSITRSEHTRCHVAWCVGIPEAHANAISSSRPTIYRHQHLVREYMGVSRWNASAQQQVENTIETLASVRTHLADKVSVDIGGIELTPA